MLVRHFSMDPDINCYVGKLPKQYFNVWLFSNPGDKFLILVEIFEARISEWNIYIYIYIIYIYITPSMFQFPCVNPVTIGITDPKITPNHVTLLMLTPPLSHILSSQTLWDVSLGQWSSLSKFHPPRLTFRIRVRTRSSQWNAKLLSHCNLHGLSLVFLKQIFYLLF